MIKGIGTDIVNIQRIKRLMDKDVEAFTRRILAPEELKRLEEIPESQKLLYVAKRFAGKEAFAKAMGSGIGEELEFRDIAILNENSGKPYIRLQNQDILVGAKVEISLSDDAPFAVAFVVISN